MSPAQSGNCIEEPAAASCLESSPAVREPVGFSDTRIDGVTYKVAAGQAELEAAFRLAHTSYARAGLMKPNSFGMRVMPYHLLKSTAVFIAQLDGEVICTVTLVGDGDLGLPMESIYAKEVKDLRLRGMLLGEVSCLADRRRELRPGFGVLMNLNRLMAQYARYNGLDALLIAVHPRHERFYSRYMAFERIGSEKPYGSVLGNPAVAASLEFDRIDRERPDAYGFFFGEPIPSAALEPRPMSDNDREYFARRVTQSVPAARSEAG